MKISKSQLAWSGLQDALLRLLKRWRPQPLHAELEYREALFDYLRHVLPQDAKIEKEYRHGGTTCDLYLRRKEGFPFSSDTEVFLELKHNLTKKSQFDRLVGQIQGLNPERRNIVVVLTGERNPALVGRLREQYAQFLGESGFWTRETQMTVVEVP